MFDKIQKIDDEIEKLSEEMFKKEGDVTDLHNRIEELEKERDSIYKEMADAIAEKVAKEEGQFQNTSFEKDSDPYILMESVATGQIKAYNTDDFQYGDWQSLVPTGWNLDRYYDAMHSLQELFKHLGNFQVDVSYHFPEQQLYIRWNNGVVVTLDFIVGQGSDFSISLQSNREKPKFEFVLDWEDALRLSKVNTWKKAMWYVRNVLVKDDEEFENLSETDKSILMYRLGQLSTSDSKGFLGLTATDWKQEIEEWKKD